MSEELVTKNAETSTGTTSAKTAVPLTSLSAKSRETAVIVEPPGLDQKNSSEVKPGTKIRYTNKDSGRELPPFSSRDGKVNRHEGLRMTPGDEFVVGEDITIDLARRLTARGYCEVV